MKAIILSAGRSSRFAAVGWTIPKQLLPMTNGDTLIEWQVQRMKKITKDVVVVLNKEHYLTTRKYVNGCKIRIVKDAPGVLNTILQILPEFFTKEPVIITYVDSFMQQYEYSILAAMSPWLEAINVVFSSDDKRFNYPVDGFADGGIYKFKSGWKFIQLIAKYPPPYTDKDGTYLLVKVAKQKTFMVSSTHTDVGTPDDYSRFMHKFGMKVEVR